MMNQELSFHPLTADRWRDLEQLFGPRGAVGGCWCMWWRQSSSDHDRNKGEANRLALKAIVEAGKCRGFSPTGRVCRWAGAPLPRVSVIRA